MIMEKRTLINCSNLLLSNLFLKDSIVLFLTFVRGLLFANTYYKTILIHISIKQVIYCGFLFTEGMETILEFPILI